MLTSSALLALGGWWGFVQYRAKPRAAIEASLRDLNGAITRYDEELARGRRTAADLDALTRTSLAPTLDLADHELRRRLGALALERGLTEVEVQSKRPTSAISPASSAREPKVLARQLDTQIDFQAIEATLTGLGTLRSALTLVEQLRVQPWAHRVDAVSLRPMGKQRELVQLSATVHTLVFPSRPGVDHRPPADAPLGPESLERVEQLAQRNVFAPLPPPAPEPPRPEPAPAVEAAPKQPPRHLWRVTGVVRRPGPVWEVWVANSRSGEHRVLTAGQRVLDATLVDVIDSSAGPTINAPAIRVLGDHAVFEIEGQRWLVAPGQTLADRTPLGKP